MARTHHLNLFKLSTLFLLSISLNLFIVPANCIESPKNATALKGAPSGFQFFFEVVKAVWKASSADISRTLSSSLRGIGGPLTGLVYLASMGIGVIALLAFYESPISPLPIPPLPDPPVGRFPPEHPIWPPPHRREHQPPPSSSQKQYQKSGASPTVNYPVYSHPPPSTQASGGVGFKRMGSSLGGLQGGSSVNRRSHYAHYPQPNSNNKNSPSSGKQSSSSGETVHFRPPPYRATSSSSSTPIKTLPAIHNTLKYLYSQVPAGDPLNENRKSSAAESDSSTKIVDAGGESLNSLHSSSVNGLLDSNGGNGGGEGGNISTRSKRSAPFDLDQFLTLAMKSVLKAFNI